jgi:hypothetical protein
VSRARLTLLVEDFAALAAAAEGATCPHLERWLARGRDAGAAVADADRLRLVLFGGDDRAAAPVAALGAAADGLAPANDARHWLRVDPVTLTADLTRVFLTAHGLPDTDAGERDELFDCVRGVLADYGLDLRRGASGDWLLALEDDPGCDFTRLDAALGCDVGETLPAGDAAREWRRILTDVQVGLHHCEVNRRRRAGGRREINAAWIWGGGRLPRAPEPVFGRVFSDHPVSRGLAALAGSALAPLADAEAGDGPDAGGSMLVDWTPGPAGARRELDRLEAFAGALAPALRRGALEVRLLDGGGAGRRVDRGALRRFWRRPQALARQWRADGPEGAR